MNPFVCLIHHENFAQEVAAEKKPLLVLCMPRDDQFPQQVKIIEEVSAKHSPQLKVGLVQEEFIEAFKKFFNFKGTPTFLILVKGKEKARLLGQTDLRILTDWMKGLHVLH